MCLKIVATNECRCRHVAKSLDHVSQPKTNSRPNECKTAMLGRGEWEKREKHLMSMINKIIVANALSKLLRNFFFRFLHLFCCLLSFVRVNWQTLVTTNELVAKPEKKSEQQSDFFFGFNSFVHDRSMKISFFHSFSFTSRRS